MSRALRGGTVQSRRYPETSLRKPRTQWGRGLAYTALRVQRAAPQRRAESEGMSQADTGYERSVLPVTRSDLIGSGRGHR